MSTDLDVKAYIASKGFVYREVAGGREIVLPCPACGEPPDSRKKKLYANVTDGWWQCKVCEEQGGTYLLQKLFGDDPQVGDGPALPDLSARRTILTQAAAVGAQMLTNNDDQMLYLLNERGLWPETIIERQIGLVTGDWSLTQSLPGTYSREQLGTTGLIYRDGPRMGRDFFYNHLLIPYHSRGSVVQVRGRLLEAGGSRYMTGPGEEVRLFNTDSLDDAEEVLVIEGEFDTLVVEQALSLSPEERVRRIAVVGIPGVGAFKEEWVTYFSGARRVYLGFDPDEAGVKGAQRVKEILGSKTRIITWPRDILQVALERHKITKVDWTEYVVKMGATWREIYDLMSSASGKRLYTVRDSGVSWRNARKLGRGVKTGYEQFDKTILPGLLPGQLMVVLAKTGVGKTLLLCNLAYFMRHEKILFITLEMTREEIYERMRRIYLFHHPAASDEEIDDALSTMLIYDENRLSEKDFEQLIKEYEDEVGVRATVILLDYLGYYARSVEGRSPYEKTSNAVMDLKERAKRAQVAMIAPHQVNRTTQEGRPIDVSDARDSGVVEETADFLLSIFVPDDAVAVNHEGKVVAANTLRLGVLKSRHGGKGRHFTLTMDRLSLAIVEADAPAAKRAKDHNFLYWRGYTWDTMRVEETRPVQQMLGGGE